MSAQQVLADLLAQLGREPAPYPSMVTKTEAAMLCERMGITPHRSWVSKRINMQPVTLESVARYIATKQEG